MVPWCGNLLKSEIVFVGPEPTNILYINATNDEENGGISLYMADTSTPESATFITSLPAPYAGLKAAETSGGDIRFLMYCKANLDGSAYSPTLQPADPGASSARVYDGTYIRLWV